MFSLDSVKMNRTTVPLETKLVAEIKKLLVDGETYRAIAKRVGVSKSSVARINQQLGNCVEKRTPGRKCVLSAFERGIIFEYVVANNCKNATKIQQMLQSDHRVSVSVESVRKILKSEQLKNALNTHRMLNTMKTNLNDRSSQDSDEVNSPNSDVVDEANLRTLNKDISELSLKDGKIYFIVKV